MDDKDKYVLVGVLGKTRSVHGEIYVTPYTDFPDRFIGLKKIFLDEKNGWREIEIESARIINGRPVLKFAGVNSKEDAARLTNIRLAVDSSELVELPEGSYYQFDLIDCAVIDKETKEKIGVIVGVEQYPANDAYLIKTDEGREFLIPAVKEYIYEVNLNKREIIVSRKGIIDEN